MKTKGNIIKTIIEFFNEYDNLVFLYIFGSFVEDDKYNDIDLAFYSQDELSDLISVSVRLEQNINIPVDLIDIKKAPDHLVYSISKGEVIIDNDEDFRVDFITTAWSKYFDFKYYRDRYLKELTYNG